MNVHEAIRETLKTGVVERPTPESALFRLSEIYKNSESHEERNAGQAIYNLSLDLAKTKKYAKRLEEAGERRSFEDIYRNKYLLELGQLDELVNLN